MYKKFLVVLVLSVLLAASVSARSLINISLGVGGAYTPSGETGYAGGMENPDNWMFGGELSVRLAMLQAQMLAFPIQCTDEGQGVLLIGFGSLNIPLVGSLLFLELGAGASVTYVPSNESNQVAYYLVANQQSKSANQMSFTEAALDSPLYLQFGLGSEIGSVGFRARYLLESKTTLGSVLETSAWWEIFQLRKGVLSLALSLKMF